MSRLRLPRGTGRRRALQSLRGANQLVEVRHLGRVVAPCAADRTVLRDEERASIRDATVPPEVPFDAERLPSTPNACIASLFQSERSGKFRSSAWAHAMCVHSESPEMPNGRTPALRNSGLLSRRSSISCVQVADQSKR